MNLKEDLTQLLQERSCNVEWVDEDSEIEWSYNTSTFLEDNKAEF